MGASELCSTVLGEGGISGLLCVPMKLVAAPEQPVNRDLDMNSR